MMAWYEGVSERLRREAEEEERTREIEAEQAEVRRLRQREEIDDEGSVDSRGPALAYFRNPLYRHVDGRPTIVRRNSKRPALSPRPTTMKDRAKEGATTMGHVIRNIGSPHLWEGRNHGPPKGHSRERHSGSHRRRSLPDNRYHYPGEPPPSAIADPRPSPGYGPNHHRHRPSVQLERPATASTDDEWNSDSPAPPLRSPRPGSRHHNDHDDADPTLRHSRSHEPTPSQRDYPDYFYGYDDPSHRRNSTQASEGPPTPNGVGPSFGPSASPLFASHVAKRPQPQMPPPRRPPVEPQGPARGTPSMRREQGRPYSRSPDPGLRPHSRDNRRYSSRERRETYDRSPAPMYDEGPTSAPAGQPGFPPIGSAPGDPRASMPPPGSAPPNQPGYPMRDRMPSRDRRPGRSASDVSYGGAEERDDSRRRGPTKQTRFASGVDGRRYPNESGWR